jgi:hypothetical protein
MCFALNFSSQLLRFMLHMFLIMFCSGQESQEYCGNHAVISYIVSTHARDRVEAGVAFVQQQMLVLSRVFFVLFVWCAEPSGITSSL